MEIIFMKLYGEYNKTDVAKKPDIHTSYMSKLMKRQINVYFRLTMVKHYAISTCKFD